MKSAHSSSVGVPVCICTLFIQSIADNQSVACLS
jgi:hypothetical protein